MSKPTDQDMKDFLRLLLNYSEEFVAGQPPNAHDRKAGRRSVMLKAKELLDRLEPAVYRTDTSASVYDLGLPARVANRLAKEEIYSVSDIQKFSLIDLAVLPDMGRTSLKYIEISMANFQWDLKDLRHDPSREVNHKAAQMRARTLRTDTEISVTEIGLPLSVSKRLHDVGLKTVFDLQQHSLWDVQWRTGMSDAGAKSIELAMDNFKWDNKSRPSKGRPLVPIEPQ